MEVNQGDVYWVRLKEWGEPETSIAHPHVVIQDNVINHSRVNTVVVCAMTTNAKRANSPGNVCLDAGEANLPKPSIVVVSLISTVEKTELGEFVGKISQERVDQILAGMQFIQRMTGHRE